MVRPAFADSETTTISVNKVYTGSISYDGETYYSFTLTKDGNVTLSMLRNAQSSWKMQLTNSNGDTLKDFVTNNGPLSTGYEERQVGLAKGTYYLRIADNSNGSLNPFKFQVKFTAATNYEKEGNQTFTSANPIQLNTTFKGTLQDYYDQDYYVFTTQQDGNVTLSMKRNPNISWHVTLYSADGTAYKDFVTASGNTAKGNEERQIGLPKGTYYVSVEKNTYTEDIGYEFQVKFTAGSQFEKESNGTVDSANTITPNKIYQGVLQDYYDDDFYTFTLPSDGNVTLSMKKNTSSSWTVKLYSVNGDEYESYTTSYGSNSTGVEERQIGLPKGKYYVEIYNNSNTTDVPYEFQVKYDAGNYYEKETNDTLDTANPISLNAVYQGVLQGYYDQDSYSFSIAKTQQVKISIPRKSGVSWEANLYNANGDNLGYFTTDYQSTVSGNQESIYTLKPGKYFLVLSQNYNSTDVPYQFALWTSTPQITPDQVTVTNNTSKNDAVTVGGLGSGDIIKVYNASKGGTLLATAKAGSSGNVSMSIKQVGLKAGSLYVTVTKSGWTESARTPTTFNGELSKPLTSTQVKIDNNKGKPDVMTINGLGTGDIVNVYNTAGKLIGVSMPTENGQAAIAFVQLGTTAGKVNVSVIRAGMTESTKVPVSFKAE